MSGPISQFIERHYRHFNAATLVEAAEAWARERGHTEIASDTDPDNRTSIAAHRALGYEEVGRAVCFRKPLGDPG